MPNLTPRRDGAKPVLDENPSTPGRLGWALRQDLAHPAVTPIIDVPPPPIHLKPWHGPSGFGGMAPLPPGISRIGLELPQIALAILIASKMPETGHPCLWIEAPNVTQFRLKLAELAGMPESTARTSLQALERHGLVAVEPRLWRDSHYYFVWALFGLREDFIHPEYGVDRDDPACEIPHRPRFVIPGAVAGAMVAETVQVAGPGAGPGAISAAGIPLQVAPPPAPSADRAATGATEPAVAKEVASNQPVETAVLAPVAHVYGVSPEGEKKNTSTSRESAAPCAASTGYESRTVEEILAFLARNDVYSRSFLYTTPILELKARSIPIPARYEGKPLISFDGPKPAPEPKRYAPPPAPPVDPSKMLPSARLKRLEGLDDPAEVEAMTWVMMEILGEHLLNRVSINFHRRNMRAISEGTMPAQVVIDELTSFRNKTAQKPRHAFGKNVANWWRVNVLGKDPEAERRYHVKRGRAGAKSQAGKEARA